MIRVRVLSYSFLFSILTLAIAFTSVLFVDLTSEAAGQNESGQSPSGKRLPGSSIASSLLQHDVFMPALTAAQVLDKGGHCRVRELPITKLVKKPTNAKGVLVSDTWKEEWAFNLCGKIVYVPITFIPDGKGGTSYAIKMDEVQKRNAR